MRHAIYLHGFASSARSKKAAFFRERLAACGVPLTCPDFNEPDFSTLTLSRMIAQCQQAIAVVPEVPIAVIGSSLGALVALQAAVRRPDRIDRLVLLAPAVAFVREGWHLNAAEIARWRDTNRREVFHYGYGETRSIGFALYEDARQYDPAAVEIAAPILIFYGVRDDVVRPESVRRFAEGRKNVMLHPLDDDHQLLGSLEEIWDNTKVFLELAG